MNKVGYLLKHRFVIYMLTLTLCVAGLFCLFTIPIAPFPLPKFNNFLVQINYSGANADTVQQQITTKVVNALQALPYVEQIRANSSNGEADIHFEVHSSDPNIVMQTQMRVNQAIAGANLPTAASQPEINQDSGQSGLLTYMATSDHLTLFQISNYLVAHLYPTLNSIPGAMLDYDQQNPVIHIHWLPAKLAQYKLQPEQISLQVDQAFQSAPLGKLYISNQPYTLLLKNPLQSLPDFSHLIVGHLSSTDGSTAGNPIHLGDIATISFGPRQPIIQSTSLSNGHLAINFGLYTTGIANPFLVSKISTAAVQKIKNSLPADMHITKVDSSVKNMQASFNEVSLTIAIASLLVLLIAWMFLGRLRLTIIPIVTIPICLLGSMIFINLLGFSLNIITLLAMVIAVGLVVDDSIVVVENIIRYMETGLSKHEAIIQGTSSIALTIVGITATLLAVYLPISFVHGQAFIFFLTAFAVPLAAAVFISGIVALTLTPIMCVTFISSAAPSHYQKYFNACLEKTINAYHYPLKKVLAWPKLSLIFIIVLISAGIYLMHDMPRQFFPDDPSGSIVVSINGDANDTIQSLKTKMSRFSSFSHDKKVKRYFLNISPDNNTKKLQARLFIHYLNPYLHYSSNFVKQIDSFIKAQKLDNTSVRMNKFSNSGGDVDMPATLYESKTVTAVNNDIERLTQFLKKSPIFSSVDNNIALVKKQLAFTIDDAQAARFGIYHTDIASLLEAYYGGYTLRNNFEIAGLSVPVIIGLDSASLQDPKSLQQLQIKSSDGHFYPLTQFVQLKMVAHPTQISTFNSKPSVAMQMQLAKGHSLGEAISYFNSTVAHLTPDMSIQYDGAARDYIEGSSQSIWVMVLGIGCVYLLLALLFHSLLDPFIILLTVPFSVVGGALVLHWFGGTINLYSTLSLITLVGLITKHGVLIVRFANAQLKQGASVQEAVLQATHDRFRPIIMTTLAMTLGVLPLALSYEVMYVARQDLSIVLMGGLLIGTLFSLFIVPLIYAMLKKQTTHQTNHLLNQDKNTYE